MPEISGIDFLQMLFAVPEYANIPVISLYSIFPRTNATVVSATDELQLVYHCLKLGAADFLTKPIHVKQVENIWQTIWRKNKEEENKAKEQENIQQELESKVTEAVSTPIKVSILPNT
jgi:FixJ family two-component response regulator